MDWMLYVSCHPQEIQGGNLWPPLLSRVKWMEFKCYTYAEMICFNNQPLCFNNTELRVTKMIACIKWLFLEESVFFFRAYHIKNFILREKLAEFLSGKLSLSASSVACFSSQSGQTGARFKGGAFGRAGNFHRDSAKKYFKGNDSAPLISVNHSRRQDLRRRGHLSCDLQLMNAEMK